MEETQRKNKVIWKDTYRIVDHYPQEKSLKLDNVEFSESEDIDKKIIKVFNEDTITTLLQVLKANFKPLVLIDANEMYSLESAKHGVISTECDFYRFTNISAVVQESSYPLRDLEMIYCPKITIFKNIQNKMLPKHLQFSLVLSPPIKRPALISIKTENGMEDVYDHKSEEEKMQNKIENIFKLALNKGFNCLILTDFGCQTGSNPIKKVVEMFNQAIKKYPIKYVFFSIKIEKNFKYFHNHITRS